jgi:hypothetical protein
MAKKGNYKGAGLKHHKWLMVSQDRVANVRTFISALRDHLNAIPIGDWSKPLEHPVVEYGYAENSPTRLKQYARHDSSNYIMNVMEAVAVWAARNNTPNDDFRIEQ